jgi:hypothetical protein
MKDGSVALNKWRMPECCGKKICGTTSGANINGLYERMRL